MKQILSVASQMFKRKIDYDDIKEKQDLELADILYDEYVAKYKTEHIALRHFEQFLIGIKKYK